MTHEQKWLNRWNRRQLLDKLTDAVLLERFCGDKSDDICEQALQAIYDMYGHLWKWC